MLVEYKNLARVLGEVWEKLRRVLQSCDNKRLRLKKEAVELQRNAEQFDDKLCKYRQDAADLEYLLKSTKMKETKQQMELNVTKHVLLMLIQKGKLVWFEDHIVIFFTLAENGVG